MNGYVNLLTHIVETLEEKHNHYKLNFDYLSLVDTVDCLKTSIENNEYENYLDMSSSAISQFKHFLRSEGLSDIPFVDIFHYKTDSDVDENEVYHGVVLHLMASENSRAFMDAWVKAFVFDKLLSAVDKNTESGRLIQKAFRDKLKYLIQENEKFIEYTIEDGDRTFGLIAVL